MSAEISHTVQNDHHEKFMSSNTHSHNVIRVSAKIQFEKYIQADGKIVC